LATDSQYTEEWGLWKKQHGKQYYSNEDELSRRTIWETNRNYVQNHNKQAHMFGFTLAMNKFADMESKEFAQMYNSYMHSFIESRSRELFVPTVSVADVPDSMDWRQKGYVTPVKDQDQCGSCWAFSATGSLEGQHFNATGKLVSLSEQNLIDCSRPEGNVGCNGGLMDDAFRYIIKNGGIDTEASYPYKAHDDWCKYKARNRGATISSYVDIKQWSESDLQVAVGTVGPISAAIDASSIMFQLYEGGVYYDRMCSQTRLDHGVLVVGYGSEWNKDYWLVKNSWGKKWGQNGYIKMARNRNNHCGIATGASFPIV